MTGGNIRTLLPTVPSYGLFFPGVVTDYTDVNNFACQGLTGYGNNFFADQYWICVISAGAAAPQGEARLCTAYNSVTGFFTHAAFSVPIEVDDIVLLIHVTQYEPIALRGGAQTIQSLHDNQQAMLDLAEYPTISLLCDGNEQTVYESPFATADGVASGATAVFFFAGGFIDWTGANAGVGEDTIVKVKVKVDGTNYRVIYEETFLAAAVPVPAVTPFPRSVNTKPTPESFYSKQDVTVTIEQGAVGGGWNTLDIRTYDAARGG